MGSWIKLESDIITNAKVGQAGENGDRLYFCLLALHAKHGANGRIPSSRCTPAGLRIEAVAVLGRLTVAKIAKAIADCVQVGLIELENDGAVRLCGFDVHHMPECSRCHQPNPEPSHGTCPTCREKKQAERRAYAAEKSGNSRRAEKGMPSSAGGQTGESLSLQDRIGGEGIGEEEDREPASGVLSVPEQGVVPPSYAEERARSVSALVAGAASSRRVRA